MNIPFWFVWLGQDVMSWPCEGWKELTPEKAQDRSQRVVGIMSQGDKPLIDCTSTYPCTKFRKRTSSMTVAAI